MRLAYAIKFVADMEKAVAFHRDALGLPLAFQSPDWSEFATGETRLALHIASAAHPAGSVQLGYRTEAIDAFMDGAGEKGIVITSPVTERMGLKIARFADCEGAECSLSGT